MQFCRPSAPLLAVSLLISLTLIPLTRAWATPEERLLHVFSNKDSKGGGRPTASLLMDAAGNLYGTTWEGGDTQCSYFGCGVVFELSPGSNGKWTEKILRQFHGADGAYPSANLISDAGGNLYGTTAYGGKDECSNSGGGQPTCGLVFELSRGSNGTWTEIVLHKFHGKDGAFPFGTLAFDAAGNLYGTTRDGGGGLCNCGVVFELSPTSRDHWTETVLHRFGYNTDGSCPYSGLVFGQSGSLYGTASQGGAYGGGVVFELAAGSKGKWTEKILYQFNPNHGEGEYGPYSTLVVDGAGSLYGTTTFGGSVFRLTPGSHGKWTETDIFSVGGNPQGALIFDSQGNLYGTTQQGGNGKCANGCGTVFELIPHPKSWSRNILYEFNVTEGDGSFPQAGVIFDGAGNLYGTTWLGGPRGDGSYGTVFEITP
jgi:uncharacterized repeat protein (TIGR03803 family)